MGIAEKIAFPYGLSGVIGSVKTRDETAVFFGADFLGMEKQPGFDKQLFVDGTNAMLAYMRRNFPNSRLLYQPHPNEVDEHTYLDLQGFERGEKMVAEVFLYTHAADIVFVLSACSGASVSAYAMGFNAFVGIKLLEKALSPEIMSGYREYLAGTPESFFLNSLDATVPSRSSPAKEDESHSIARLKEAVGSPKKLWVLVQSPSFMVQASLILKYARAGNPDLKAGILKVGGGRWRKTADVSTLERDFDDVVHVREHRVLYSARPLHLLKAALVAFSIRNLPIKRGDAVVSFCYTMFEEDCIISYFKKKARMIGIIENRWFHFTFVDMGKSLPASGFRAPLGALAFAWILEPLLGLYRTITKEYGAGVVINIFRYRAPLESVYDIALVTVPMVPKGDAKITTGRYTPLT